MRLTRRLLLGIVPEPGSAEAVAWPPWELVESNLCESFHCLPSQLDGEDWERIIGIMTVREVQAAAEGRNRHA